MKNTINTIDLLFQNYGTIELLEEDDNHNMLYKFLCNPKTICTKENLFYNFNSIKFALICTSNSKCNMYCFRIGSGDKNDNKTLYILNEVNRISEYGKYVLDSDNDINWEYTFEIDSTEIEDIEDILISFFENLYQFVYIKLRGKNE